MNNIKLVKYEEIAELLNTTVGHVRSMVYKKKIPYIKIGGYIRFNLEAINDWIEARSNDCEK